MKIKKSLDRSLWTETNGFIVWNLFFRGGVLKLFYFSYTAETPEGQNNMRKVLNFSQLKHSLAICLVLLENGNIKLLF